MQDSCHLHYKLCYIFEHKPYLKLGIYILNEEKTTRREISQQELVRNIQPVLQTIFIINESVLTRNDNC